MSAAFNAGASLTPSYRINISRKVIRNANEKTVTNTNINTHQ
jgi:hypothetical protein